jgi:predicted RNase H-like HicB family nuclease
MRKHYIAFVHAGPSAYGVSFPDFPGVVTAARTIDAAVERAGEMLARHVEGMLKDGELIPPPRSFEDVKKLAPNYQDAMLVLVPLLPPSA